MQFWESIACVQQAGEIAATMRRRSNVWLVAVAHALTPPAGLRKLTRSVASPELLSHNDACHVPAGDGRADVCR